MTKPKDWDPDWIGRLEARRILGVSESGIDRLISMGKVIRSDRPSRAYSRHQVVAFANTDEWAGDWVDTVQAAEILGVSPRRVRQLATADLVPYETDYLGRRRYRRQQIEVVAYARLARWHDGVQAGEETSNRAVR